MSVIVGMDMPKSCYACKLRKGCNCIIKKMYLPDLSVQNQDCPLKSIDGLIDKIIERIYPDGIYKILFAPAECAPADIGYALSVRIGGHDPRKIFIFFFRPAVRTDIAKIRL